MAVGRTEKRIDYDPTWIYKIILIFQKENPMVRIEKRNIFLVLQRLKKIFHEIPC